MIKRTGSFLIFLLAVSFQSGCQNEKKDPIDPALLVGAMMLPCLAGANATQSNLSYSTGFESINDFSGYYLVPQNYQGTDTHSLSTTQVRTGTYAHDGTMSGAGPTCPSWQNCNHRGYPTIQLHKRPGSFARMVFVEFYAYLTMTVADQQWFSFATLSPDASDAWARTVTVNVGNLNLGTNNYIHLMHVPGQGQSNWTYQAKQSNGGLAFPSTPQWVKISICIDFHPTQGSAKVWQNDVLVSAAPVSGGCGYLHQAHFGMYAIPPISSGHIYNDDLTIQEVSSCPK